MTGASRETPKKGREQAMKAAEFAFPAVLAAYDWGGDVLDVSRYGMGHINETYRVAVSQPDGAEKAYILQKVNTDIFRDPEGLMDNIVRVTEYLRDYLKRTGGDAERGAMTVIPTRDGRSWYRGENDACWRVYIFVTDTICLQQVERDSDFYESAVAFGNFQNQLSDYPAGTLHETIPHFHDTVSRYAAFEKAVLEDRAGRAASVQADIDFIRARKQDCAFLMNLLGEGKLPLRVTHNDTKLNNVLLDAKTRKGVCVIDLDTVMPGLAAWDFGDAIRYGANDCPEDEPDVSKVYLNMQKYETYLRGYLDAAGAALTPLEKETLPWGARVITLETGIRFLTDYLEGDHYFRIRRPNQNLDRTRKMLKLTEDMEAHFAQMKDAVARYGRQISCFL